jgi:Na+/phosphate symporter
MDPTLDRLSVAVRRYLAELSGEELNEEDSFRSQEIFAFTINSTTSAIFSPIS